MPWYLYYMFTQKHQYLSFDLFKAFDQIESRKDKFSMYHGLICRQIYSSLSSKQICIQICDLLSKILLGTFFLVLSDLNETVLKSKIVAKKHFPFIRGKTLDDNFRCSCPIHNKVSTIKTMSGSPLCVQEVLTHFIVTYYTKQRTTSWIYSILNRHSNQYTAYCIGEFSELNQRMFANSKMVQKVRYNTL